MAQSEPNWHKMAQTKLEMTQAEQLGISKGIWGGVVVQSMKDVIKIMSFYEKRAKVFEECSFFAIFSEIGRKRSDFYPGQNLMDLHTAIGFLFCKDWDVSENLNLKDRLNSWEIMDLMGGVEYLREGILSHFSENLGPYSKIVVNKLLGRFGYSKRVK
jgi:hypothetical protein